MINVDIISGFLGAGKTTLIKKLFESSFKDENVVIIENEFGEIGIDKSFLKNSGVEIKEINAGCICCSLVGDFSSSIKEILERFNPDRIIIEPSGVGKLSDIINAIKRLELDCIKINILATVVDGPKTIIYLKNFGEFFLNQVESADTIIVSKTDKMDETKIDEVVEIIKNKNNHANIITTSIKDLDSQTLLKTLEEKSSLKDKMIDEMIKECDEEECCCHGHHQDEDECECYHEHHHHEDEEECCCHGHHQDEDECECHHEHHHHEDEEECCCHGHHHDEDECECHHEHHHHEDCECGCHEHHHHDADEVFSSWGKETARAFSKVQLDNFLSKLSEQKYGLIVRCKGILKASDNDKWYYFDYVSGDYEIRLGEAEYTGRIVVIGSKVNEVEIEKLLFGE